MSVKHQITSTVELAEDVEQGIAVKNNGSGKAVAVTANTDSVWGVTVNGGSSGDLVAIVRAGECRMQVDDASLSDGDKASFDSSGRAVADSGGGETVIGEALQDGISKPASEDAARVRVMLLIDKS
jgi:hypothetical protein